jgi:hypothetical protein
MISVTRNSEEATKADDKQSAPRKSAENRDYRNDFRNVYTINTDIREVKNGDMGVAKRQENGF